MLDGRVGSVTSAWCTQTASTDTVRRHGNVHVTRDGAAFTVTKVRLTPNQNIYFPFLATLLTGPTVFLMVFTIVD